MRGEQSRAAALFDVGGDKNDDDTDDDDDVFVGGGGGGGGVGACANMYGRKPTKVVLFLCEAAVQRHEQKLQTVPLVFPLLLCVLFRVLKCEV